MLLKPVPRAEIRGAGFSFKNGFVFLSSEFYLVDIIPSLVNQTLPETLMKTQLFSFPR